MEKTYNNTTAKQAQDQVKDIEFWGDGDLWKLISKASSKKEGWMKSTKAMELHHGCLVQVTTQQGDHVAEAITFVPGVCISELADGDGGPTTRRYLDDPKLIRFNNEVGFNSNIDLKLTNGEPG